MSTGAQPPATRPPRPRPSDQVEVTIESLAHGGAGVGRLEGYVLFVRGAIPGDRVRAVVTKSKRPTARPTSSSCSTPSPERIAPGRRPPRRAVAGPALRAPARGQGRAGRGRAAAHRPARRLRDGADRRRRAAVALPQQGRVLVRDRPGRSRPAAGLRLPRHRQLGGHRRHRRLPAGLRARQRRAPRGARVLPRAGPRGLGPPLAAGASCATWSSARAAAPASCRSAWSPARARWTATRFAAAVEADGLFWTQAAGVAETTAGRVHPAPGRRARARGGARRPALRHLPRRVLPDEHRDGRACSTAIAVDYAELRGWDRVFDLYCGIGTIGLSLAGRAGRAVGRRDRRGGGRATRSPTPGATRSPTRSSSPATCGSRCASSCDKRRPARRARRRPAARRPVAEDRPARDRGRAQADRLRLLQPDHARAQRRPARRGRLRR